MQISCSPEYRNHSHSIRDPEKGEVVEPYIELNRDRDLGIWGEGGWQIE